MNLEAETRQGYYISAEMKKVWQIQITMFQKLIDICQRHNLNIWADSGTLIGAVRNNGYIPWDDDIDTIMMRDDYEKLKTIIEEELKGTIYHFVEREKYYPRFHAQLRCDGTAAIRHTDIWKNIHQGIFIDIFIYDGVPEDPVEVHKMRNLVYKKQSLCRFLCSNEKSFKGYIKRLISKTYFLFKPFDKLYNECESIYRKYKIEDHNRIYQWSFSAWKLEKRNIRKNWYTETIWLPFEDIKIPAPAGYHELLTCEYGDYMKPSKAPSAHGDVIFDTERHYKEVLQELRNKK